MIASGKAHHEQTISSPRHPFYVDNDNHNHIHFIDRTNPVDVEIREILSQGTNKRLDIGEDDTLHLLVGPLTIQLDKPSAIELATTLSIGLVKTIEAIQRTKLTALRLITTDNNSSPQSSL